MRRRAVPPPRLPLAHVLTYREVVIVLQIDAGRGQKHRTSAIKTDEMDQELSPDISFNRLLTALNPLSLSSAAAAHFALGFTSVSVKEHSAILM